MEEQGLGFNLVSLTKADMKSWNSHQKRKDLLSLFCLSVLLLQLAKVKWLIETALKSFCPLILAYGRAKAD